MDVREKLVELLTTSPQLDVLDWSTGWEEAASYLVAHGVTVREWIDSEEVLPQFPCLALDANGNPVFIPDGMITVKDNHGEWCIDASLTKEVRYLDGTKIDALLWENRIAYWMPLPQPPKRERR